MKILVTGFTPFGGETLNPSWEAVRALDDSIAGADIIKCEIPTREFDSSFFGVLIQILYLSHLWLIFLSNFMILYVLFSAVCCIIELTGRFAYVYQYHRQ